MTNAKQSDLKSPLAPIRVLVVDDQSFMRIALRKILEADGDIRVVGEAQNGIEAIAMARELRPDAITLDIEMPEMDGLEACATIAREVAPRPAIIMVSAHTQKGAEAAVKALELGAVDFVSKSSNFAKTDLSHIDSELPPKLRAWVKRRPLAAGPVPSVRITHGVSPHRVDLVVNCRIDGRAAWRSRHCSRRSVRFRLRSLSHNICRSISRQVWRRCSAGIPA